MGMEQLSIQPTETTPKSDPDNQTIISEKARQTERPDIQKVVSEIEREFWWSYPKESLELATGVVVQTIEGSYVSFASINWLEDSQKSEIYELVDKISETILDRQWGETKLQDFPENTMQSLEKVEIVTHPLFWLFAGEEWDSTAWEESGRNAQKYIQTFTVGLAQETLRELENNPNSIPASYLYLVDFVQELKALQKTPASWQARVLLLPRWSQLTLDQHEAYSDLMDTMVQWKFAVTDSQERWNGHIQSSDIAFLTENLTQGAHIEIQGGYIIGCLNNTHDDLTWIASSLRPDIEVQVDYPASTQMIPPQSSTDASPHPHLSSAWTIRPPKSNLTTLSSVMEWIEDNGEITEALDTIAQENFDR